MPQLPRYESQVAAQENRRIIDQPRVGGGSAIGEALQQAGKVVGEINARIEKAKTDSELVAATRTAREKFEKSKYELENNKDIPDDAIEPTLRQVGDKIISDVSEGITSQTARRLWTENAKNLQSDGDVWARKTSRARSVDRVRAGHVTAISDLEQKAGDISLSMEAYDRNLQDQRGAILRDKDRGIIDDEHAATLLAGIDKLAVKDSTIRWQSNIDALVKSGRLAEAEAMYGAGGDKIDPDVRATVRKGLDQTKQDFAVVEKTDEIWTKAGGDYAKFVKETAKINDPALRVKVEERGDRMRLMADRSEEIRQDALAAQMWKHVEAGGKIANAPPSVRAAIDPDKLGSIRAYENARDTEATMSPQAKAAHEAQSNVFRLQLETMTPERFVAGPAAWSADDKARLSMMTPADQLAINQEVVKRRQTGQTSNAVDASYSDMVNQLKRSVPDSWKIGTNDQTQEATKVLGILRGYAKTQAASGKPITTEEARKAVATALYESNQKKYPLPGGDQTENSARLYIQQQVQKGAIDPELWAGVEDELYRQNGRKATALETLQRYNDYEAGIY